VSARRRMRTARGFTLLEVLVALLVLALWPTLFLPLAAAAYALSGPLYWLYQRSIGRPAAGVPA